MEGPAVRKLFVIGIILGLATVAPSYAQQAPGAPQADTGADPHAAEEQAAQRQALGFLGYLDHGRFADSYAYTGMLIRAQLDQAAFAKQMEEKVRAGVGALL